MSFFISHRWGGDDRDPPLGVIPALLAELDDHADDVEHGSVSVTHESEWAISVTVNGFVYFENVEELGHGPFHLPEGRGSVDVVALLEALALGRLDEVRRAPWQPGYG